MKDGFLDQAGRTSGTLYFLPETPRAASGDRAALTSGSSEQGEVLNPFAPGKSEELPVKREQLQPKDDELARKREELLPEENLVLDLWGYESESSTSGKAIEQLDEAPPALVAELRRVASRTGGSGKLPIVRSREIIRELCSGRFLTARVIAELMGRDERSLRDRLLTPMVSDGELIRAYPNPSDPRQSYSSTSPAPPAARSPAAAPA